MEVRIRGTDLWCLGVSIKFLYSLTLFWICNVVHSQNLERGAKKSLLLQLPFLCHALFSYY